MELLYIALAAYSVGIGSILLPKKLELRLIIALRWLP